VGKLSAETIKNECLKILQSEDLYEYEKYLSWIKINEYQKIKLSDRSEWILKKGNKLSKYIHIHPAKYSAETIRVRSTTLKTVIALQVSGKKTHKNMKQNLENVNKIRNEYLSLSPIKSLSPEKGIYKLWKIFEE
jgi:hypothetical protein